MKKILTFLVVCTVAFGLSSCYNKDTLPEEIKIYSDKDFADSKIISIKEFKQLFYDEYGKSSSGLGKTLEITEDYVIKGKVISSDKAGNVYKSVYIYDESCGSAIELKLMVSNFVNYPVGQELYVKTKGLAIGNYRFMLSIGLPPTDEDIANGYANRNIESSVYINRHIFYGKRLPMFATDTLVVNINNYKTILNDDALGRLIRFEGVTYKTGTFDGDKYPQYLETVYLNGASDATYTNKFYDKEGLPATYAYNYNGKRYYGSALFGYEDSDDIKGNFIVRVSGYANFALSPLPQPNSKGDITAIYTKYSSKSGGYIKYQLLLNSLEGVKF
jgi:hypothetical protein